MRMRTVAGMVVVGCVAALARAGDEPKAYDVSWDEKWKVGQVVTISTHETSDTDTSMGGRTMKSEHEILDATYVVRCDGLDEKGDVSKRTLFFTAWKKTKNGQIDESLTGVRVSVDGKVWSTAEGTTPGALAKSWLDRTFSKKTSEGDNPLSKLSPPTMTVGQTWKPDPKAAAEAFTSSMEDAPFDAARVEMEVKLVSAEGTPPDATGKFEIKVRLPLDGSKIPHLPPGATVSAASGAEVVGDRTGPLTTATMLGAERMDMTMTMNMSMNQQGKAIEVAVKAKMRENKTTVAGGEIPEPKKPDAPEKPAAPDGK